MIRNKASMSQLKEQLFSYEKERNKVNATAMQTPTHKLMSSFTLMSHVNLKIINHTQSTKNGQNA